MTTHHAQGAISTHYVGFDKKTGRILAMHSRTSVDGKGHVRMTHDELTRLFASDESMLADLTDRHWDNFDILELSDHTPGGASAPMMVDLTHRKLVAQPALALIADKKQLVGDGSDKLPIRIEVRSGNNHVLHQYNGQVKVSTTRGRLSERGGLVQLKDGVGSITLTSTAETVSQVRVQARAVDDLIATGSLLLEFV